MKRQILLLAALTVGTMVFAQAQTTTKPTGALPVTVNNFRVPATDSVYMYIPGVNKYYGVARISDLFKKVDKVVGFGLSSNDYTGAEKSKLAGIQNLATANQTDAYLLSRSNHTGAQAQSTITNLVTDLAAKALDVSVVHKTGSLAETINGNKTFQGITEISTSLPSSSGTFRVSQNVGTNINTEYYSDNIRYNQGGFNLSLYAPTITANYNQTFQAKTGTVALTSDIPSLAAYALDANVVHKAGNITETITGEKTFSSDLNGGFANFSTYLSVGNSSSNVALTTGDIKYNVGANLLSVYPLTLTASRVQRYQNDDGTIALTKNYAAGQTIGANTTGNAATTTLAANSTLWKGLTYNNATPTTAPIYVMGSPDGGTYGYTPISNLKTALATTLQDVTTAGSSTSDNITVVGTGNKTLTVATNTSGNPAVNLTANGVDGGSIYYDRSTSQLRLANSAVSSALNIASNGNTMVGSTTDNGAYKFQVTGGISATGNVGINGNISAANLAGTNYTATTATGTNISTVSNGTNFYTRVGDVVTVSGSVTATNNSSGLSFFSMALPVPSNFTSATDAAGTVYVENSNGGFVSANTGGSNVALVYIGNHTNNASKVYRFTFQYIVK